MQTPHRLASKPQPSCSESANAGWQSPPLPLPKLECVTVFVAEDVSPIGDINLHLWEKNPSTHLRPGSTGLVAWHSLLLALHDVLRFSVSSHSLPQLCSFSHPLLLFPYPVSLCRCCESLPAFVSPSLPSLAYPLTAALLLYITLTK